MLNLFNLIAFQSGAYLVGLLAALIPLVVHLSRSRRTKVMRFSTTRFFTDQFVRSYRMSRIREVVLLLCRMALFGLLAFGLAQPLLPSRSWAAARTSGSRAVVLVLDDSASMGYAEGGETLFDRARTEARRVVEGLRPGDAASVVLAGRRAAGPLALFGKPTPRLDEVLQALDGAKPAALGADLPAAVEAAEGQAREAAADGKEVYVFSDLQESSWPDRRLQGDGGGSSLFVVQVRPREPVRNVGVTAVQLGSDRPLAGAPLSIRPLLSVAGDPGELTVRLVIDGEKAGEQRVERLQGGKWAAPRFHHAFDSGGWHSGYVEVEDATLAADNRRYFAVEVLDAVKVLAVDGGASAVAGRDELFFLRRALTASPEGKKSPVAVDVVAPKDLADADLAGHALVVLADLESLPPAAVDKLEDYVAGGGGLFVFLGPRADPAFYNERLQGPGRRDGGVMPASLVKRETDAGGAGDATFVGDVDYDHPALGAFREPGFASLAGPSVTFKGLWRVDPRREAAVLMRTNSGAPLLVEGAVGKGRVLLFTSSCDREWTNFPLRPSYLPWVHRLTAYLTQEPSRRETFHLTGDVVELAPAEGGGAPRVRKPDRTAAFARWDAATGLPEFDETEQPGVYAVEAADGKPAGLFAVNLEAYESKLTYLDEAGVKAGRLASRPLAVYVDDPAQLPAAGGGDSRLWAWVLLLVLAVAVAEPTLANRISAAFFARPRAVPSPAPAGRSAPPAREPSPTAEVAAR
jgi:hypothetical protein